MCSQWTKVQVDIRARRDVKHAGLEASSLTEVWKHFVSVAHDVGRSVHLLTRDHALCMQLTFSASTHHPLHSACFQACVLHISVRAWTCVEHGHGLSIHLIDGCMTSVQFHHGAGGHSGTQRYETRGSGSKLADWSVKALCERGARCWSKCAFIDAWPCTVHAVDFQCIHTSSITLSLLPGVRVTYFCACLNVRGARAWAKYTLNWRVHDQCAVGARCSWSKVQLEQGAVGYSGHIWKKLLEASWVS